MDIHEQPTQPWKGADPGQGENFPVSQPAFTASVPGNGVATPAPKRLSRRALFSGLAGAGVAVAIGGVALAEWQHTQQNGGSPFEADPGTNAQIGHLLRRAGFGVTLNDLATYTPLGFQGAVDRLLNYQQVSDQPLEQQLTAANLNLAKPQSQQQWWLLRMAGTQRPLLEKMTLFWHGVLTSSFQKVGGKDAYIRMIVQNKFLRDHAFDTFDNLLLGITSDPAMLFYLDLTKSRKNAPNENFARELMELFTLGLGHYTQQDVFEGAAALTGWHIHPGTQTARYNPADHTTRELVFLGQKGNLDYKDVIRILANHPATPWFICRKLFTFFAYENPSNDDLQPLVDAYVKSNHSMQAVMKTLLLSPQFSSPKAYRARMKSPTEFLVGSYRALDAKTSGVELPPLLTQLGQTLLAPPNVAGWPGDKVSSLWLNGGTWMSRLNYINTLIGGGRYRGSVYKPLDFQSIVDTHHIDTPEKFVDHFSAFLLDGTLDNERKGQLVDYFNTPDPRSRKGHITLSGGKSYPVSKVRGTLYLLLASPEYQLN
ncbi:DUF1800 domain-containing protein [Dictyobacter aurantiacus]|uniref:DUF1800 domain-containing protein n=1 Tax=Dictyobacter aurantiacus TaxID=1936993 RepID=A0A401ZHG1_9CHLR|nr:DUF1800 domain-containing protein [Dictyobacter aurantiacus]GCE06307.1 hypothetical protein KDAU_36360 [Dictyobacter aurantiacus]